MGIRVNPPGDIVGELDDELGEVIASRSLACQDDDSRRRPICLTLAKRVPARDDAEDVQQLALVFVDALDLYVEHARRVDFDPCAFGNEDSQAPFVR